MDILCEDIRDPSSQEKKASSKEHSHSSLKFEAETAPVGTPPQAKKKKKIFFKWLMCRQSDFSLLLRGHWVAVVQQEQINYV